MSTVCRNLKVFTKSATLNVGARFSTAFVLLGSFLLVGCDNQKPKDPQEFVAKNAEELEKQIHFVCTRCHKYPEPDTFPKSVWPRELEQAYGFIAESDLKPEEVPAKATVIKYYQSNAPESFDDPGVARLTESRRFQAQGVKSSRIYPGTTYVEWLQPKTSDPFGIACDIRSGHIIQWAWDGESVEGKVLAKAGFPAHITTTDLDQNGTRDYLVADIGDVMPSNNKNGRLLWLRDDGEKLKQITLLENVGRLVDAQPGDFDGDGDLDLVVAIFGWRKNGELLVLENQTTDWSEPQFKSKQLDPRTGVIHVPVADINSDGHLDFLALFSQEHEEIIAFLGDGTGKFIRKLLYTPDNPSYGSAGLRLTDMDSDGDLDVLFSNGDTLDLMVYKPYHSVQWLENTGEFPFKHHQLTNMCGVFQAIDADLDGDGDLDIAAASFLPSGIYFDESGLGQPPLAFATSKQLPSVLWLEQTEPGRFHQHNLELANACHPSLDAGDFDGDGDIDIVTSNCSLEQFPGFQHAANFDNKLDAMTIWKNLGSDSKTPKDDSKRE